MKKALSALIVAAIIGMVACSRGSSTTQTYEMQSGIDSVSYAFGMNVGLNLLDKDSLLNVDVVCQAIRDVYTGELKLNDDEARYSILKYMNFDVYERTKALEKQFLEDLRQQDRKFVATHSGLTYKIADIGDMKRVIRNNRDTIHLRYRILDQAGTVIDTTYYQNDTLRLAVGSMPRGVIEAAKLIGEGGHMEAWLPSNLAFGSAGCDSLGIAPNTMLYYELWLIDIEKR